MSSAMIDTRPANVWMTQRESEAVARYASLARATMLELGTFMGGTTELLARCAGEGIDVWSVDIYGEAFHTRTPDAIYRNYLRDIGNAFLVVADSAVVGRFWKTDLGMLLIDGSHWQGAPERDYLLWSRHVISGGYLLLHDAAGEAAQLEASGIDLRPYQEPLALASAIKTSLDWDHLEDVDTLAVFQRR